MEVNLQWSKLCSGIWFFAECLQKDCVTTIAMALTSIFFSFEFQEFQVVDKQRGKKFETPIGEGIQVEQKYAWSWWQASHQVQHTLKYNQMMRWRILHQGRDVGVAPASVESSRGGGDVFVQPCWCGEAQEWGQICGKVRFKSRKCISEKLQMYFFTCHKFIYDRPFSGSGCTYTTNQAPNWMRRSPPSSKLSSGGRATEWKTSMTPLWTGCWENQQGVTKSCWRNF